MLGRWGIVTFKMKVAIILAVISVASAVLLVVSMTQTVHG